MAVTFNNAQFNSTQASQGAITSTVLTGTTYTGTSLTGGVGATAVTVNGSVTTAGNHVSIDLNAAGLVAVGADSVFLGYSTLSDGHTEYYFDVPVVGLLTPVTIAVSSSAIPTAQALIPVTVGPPPNDASLPSDTVSPLFQSASVNGTTLVLTYNEILDAAHPPVSGNFVVTAGGASKGVTAVAVANNTVTLTLASAVAGGAPVTVAYTDPTAGNDVAAIQDRAGNDAITFGATVVTNTTPDTTAPLFQSASVNGNTLTLTYNEALDPANRPAAGNFVVTAGGAPSTVTGVAVANNVVTLTLGAAVANGQAVTLTYTDPTAGNDVAAIQDLAGNDALTLGITTVNNATPDTTAPLFQSASVNGNTLTLTYSEALDPANRPAAGNFVVTAGGAPSTVTGVAVANNVVTLTLGAAVANGQAVTLTYTDPTAGNDVAAIQDLAGNDALTLGLTSVNNATPDTTAPLFQSASVNGNTLTLTYSEALDPANRPAAGNFVVTAGGAPSTVTGVAVASNAVTLTLGAAVANGQAVTVAYTDPTAGNDAAAIQDLVGNDALTLAVTGVTNATPVAPDTTAPLFQSASVDGNTLTLTYSEALDATNRPAAGTFVVTAGGAPSTVTGVAVAGNAVTLTLGTPVANGQAVTVAYTDPTAGNDAAAIQDLAGNDALTLAVTGVTNATPAAPDTTAPLFQSASVDGNTLTLTYSEALDATNRPVPGDFLVTAGGVQSTVTGVAVAGNAVTLTLGTPAVNGQAVTVAYTDPSGLNDPAAIQDLAGNDALTLGTTAVTNATPDTTAPVFQSASVNGNTLTLTYSEVLDATNRPVPGNFLVTAGGAPSTVTGVAVAGNAVTLTLGTPAVNGQAVTVAYTDPSGLNDPAAIQDLAGNDAATLGTTAVDNATPDTTAPLFQSASVNGTALTLTYSEALDATNRPVPGNFLVTAGGVPSTVTGVAVAGNAVTLTLGTPVVNGQGVTVAYTDPSGLNDPAAIQDLVGNDALTLGATAVNNTTLPIPDTTAPLFQSASVNGATLTLTYSEALDATNRPVPGNFLVTAGGVQSTVTGVAVAGNAVTLTLGTPVVNGQGVTVAYTDPSGLDDPAAIQDLAGNDALTLGATAVNNTTLPIPDTTAPLFQSASVNGTALTLTYSEALDATNIPVPGDFLVTAGGVQSTVTGVAVAGNAVTLTLGTPAVNGQAVTVAYTDPSGLNDPAAIQDLVGNDAATLGTTAVNNTTLPIPDTTAPVFQSASVNGTALTLTYSEALDATNRPVPGDFLVTAGGVQSTVTGVAVAGNAVTLTLGTPAVNGQAVTVAYTDPSGLNDPAAIQDLVGNDAATLGTTAVNNTTLPIPDTTAPVFQSASVNGNLLTLNYSEALDATNRPAARDFAVTAGGAQSTVTGVTIAGNTATLTLGTPAVNGQTVTVAYTDPTVGIDDPAAIQDLAGNDALTLGVTVVNNATPVAPDTTAPLFQSASVNGNVLTLTYNEALDVTHPPSATQFDVTAGGVQNAATGVTVVGSTVTVNLATPVTAGQTVLVSYNDVSTADDPITLQDQAGNDAVSLAGAAVDNVTRPATDTTAPLFQSASVNGATLTLTYSEALDAAHPPVANDFTVTAGGARAGVNTVGVAGNIVTLTLAAPVANGAAVTVAYTDPTVGVDDPAAIQDLAGNDAATLGTTAVSNTTPDTTAPLFQSASVNGNVLTLTYSEALDATHPPVANDFAVTAGGARAGVNTVGVAGNIVTLTLAAPVANGQAVTVAYTDPTVGFNDPAAIQDLAGNDAATLAATAVSNTTPDTTAPLFQSASVDGNVLTLTYSEALDATHPPVANDFTVTAGGARAGVNTVGVAGNTVTLTLAAPVANGAAVTVAYTDPTVGANDVAAIQDLVGNDAATLGVTSVNNATPDTTAPLFQSASVNGNTLTLTYSEALDPAHLPARGNFAVTAGGVTAGVNAVGVAGNTVVLTLAAPVAAGAAVTVAYTDPNVGIDDPAAIQDLAGNDAATLGLTSVTNATPDRTAPLFQSANVNGATLTLTYSEALDAAHPPATGDFAVTAGGVTASVNAVSVAGNAVILTLGTAAANGQAVTVAYTDPTVGVDDPAAIQDLAGNDALTLAATATNTTPAAPDASAPLFQSASVDGNTLTLTYSEALDAAHPPVANDFAVTAGGARAGVNTVGVAGNTVTLTLAAPVANGQAVTVAYTDPTVGFDDPAAIQDLAGNDAATLAATAVSNTTPDTTAPLFQSASVNGNTLTLTYSEALDAAHPPVANDFTVTAGGARAGVNTVGVAGNTVVLTLAAPVANGAAVTVAYTDPTVGANDVAAIQDLVGNDAATLGTTAVSNTTPDTTAPLFQSASVNGDTLTLTYSEALDPANGPMRGDFAVTAGGVAAGVNAVGVAGNTVVLTLAAPVAAGAAVTVAYTDPSGINDVAAIQDLAGNDAATLGLTSVSNTTPDTTAPLFQSANVNGTTLTLTYSEALDAAHPPATGDFAVTAGGATSSVTGVAVAGNTVTLTLGSGVTNGQAVTVAYTDPSGGNDAAAIQDLVGNDAATLGLTSVTNTTPTGGGNPGPSNPGGGGGGGGGSTPPTTGTGTGGTPTSGGTQSNLPPDAGPPAAGGQPGSAQQPTIGTVTGTTPSMDPAGTGLQTPATVPGTPVNSATPVVSGTATPGSTVTLYDTDGKTVLGTGAADAATGAYAITSASLGEGAHVLTTTETVGGREGIASAPLAIDVDTQGPVVAFDPNITVLGPYRAILSGTVADPSGVVSVDVRTAGRDVGSAAVAADGTWNITFRTGRSFVTGIEATAVDAAGNQATAPSSYDLTFAIKGQPYRVTQDSYDPQTAAYTGSTYFKRDGGELYHSTFAPRPNGAGAYTYTGGSFFDDKAYAKFTDVYDADGTVKFQSQYNNDGTVTTSGQKDGITVPNIPNNTITANGVDDRFVFTPRAGQSVITDFQASGEGHDVIAFVGTDLSSLADVLRHTTMQGDDAVIHINPTASVELVGVSKEQISQAQSAFRFHG